MLVFSDETAFRDGCRNLLVLWREWGLDRILRDAYDSGTPLSGISAGMICWFEECTTDSRGAKRGEFGPGIALDDGVGALFQDEQLVECVSSRPTARGFRYDVRGGNLERTALSPRFLEP